MASAILNYRQIVNQLLRAIQLQPGTYYLQATSPARYLDKVGVFDFSSEKVVYLERVSRSEPESSIDGKAAQR